MKNVSLRRGLVLSAAAESQYLATNLRANHKKTYVGDPKENIDNTRSRYDQSCKNSLHQCDPPSKITISKNFPFQSLY